MLSITFLLLAAATCQAASASDDVAADQLYTDVILGEYQSAIAQTRELEQEQRGDVIKQAVNKLFENEKRNVMDFAHELWKLDENSIVHKYFPFQIGAIFSATAVKLINWRDSMVLKLGVRADRDGDRVAYGDNNHMIGDRMAWRINPITDSRNDRLYFYIYHIKNNQFLKLGTSIDGDGDHKAFGSSYSNLFRYQWYLHPVKHSGTVVFYIINREYNQALKLSRSVDSYGDRRVLSEHGNVLGNPEAFGWIIATI